MNHFKIKVLADATLPALDKAFPEAFFSLSLYEPQDCAFNKLSDHEALVCRSTLAVTSQWVDQSPLKIIATASSGTDHIDKTALDKNSIRLFDAKGSNALAVVNYVLACLAYLQQTQYVTCHQVGIIGLGAVGSLLASQLRALAFRVVGFDPLKPGFRSDPLEQVLQSDVLCLHPNLHSHPPFPSVNWVNQAFLEQIPAGSAIINAARGGIVDEQALLATDKDLFYCTDVFKQEPAINPSVVTQAILATPHIAGHTLEAKHRAVALVSQQIHQAYGLPFVDKITPPPSPQWLLSPQQWQEQVLAHYNPYAETQQLKQASDKTQAFKTLRKKHQRTEF